MSWTKVEQFESIHLNIKLNYYEIKNNHPVLVMLHAQGTNALSFKNTFKELSKHFHILAIDCRSWL